MIATKASRTFLRHLFRLPIGSSKGDRVRALNKGDQRQRMLLIHLLHQIVTGEIPLRKEDAPILQQSGKLPFLMRHFHEEGDVQRLLAMNDPEQKKVLANITNYHVLLYKIFNQ